MTKFVGEQKKNYHPQTNFNIGCLKNSKFYNFLLMCKFSQLATPSLLSKTHFTNYKVPCKEEREEKNTKHFMRISNAWRNQSARLVQLFISEGCQEVKGNGRATLQPWNHSLTHSRSWSKLVEVEHGVGWLKFGVCKWASCHHHHHHHLPLRAYFIHHPCSNCKCLSVNMGPMSELWTSLSYNCKFACCMCGDSRSLSK